MQMSMNNIKPVYNTKRSRGGQFQRFLSPRQARLVGDADRYECPIRLRGREIASAAPTLKTRAELLAARGACKRLSKPEKEDYKLIAEMTTKANHLAAEERRHYSKNT